MRRNRQFKLANIRLSQRKLLQIINNIVISRVFKYLLADVLITQQRKK